MKILLADDHGLFRDSMAVWLQQYSSDIQIDFASNWSSLENELNKPFDLILLDLGMPGMQGAATIETMQKLNPQSPILVVSANEEQQTIQTCLDAGASGYITKSSDGREILKAVDKVINGGIYKPKLVYKDKQEYLKETLSQKQIQLLAHLANGLSNREISEQMHLSEGTVKQYVSQLLSILNVDNRTQAGNKARHIMGISD